MERFLPSETCNQLNACGKDDCDVHTWSICQDAFSLCEIDQWLFAELEKLCPDIRKERARFNSYHLIASMIKFINEQQNDQFLTSNCADRNEIDCRRNELLVLPKIQTKQPNHTHSQINKLEDVKFVVIEYIKEIIKESDHHDSEIEPIVDELIGKLKCARRNMSCVYDCSELNCELACKDDYVKLVLKLKSHNGEKCNHESEAIKTCGGCAEESCEQCSVDVNNRTVYSSSNPRGFTHFNKVCEVGDSSEMPQDQYRLWSERTHKGNNYLCKCHFDTNFEETSFKDFDSVGMNVRGLDVSTDMTTKANKQLSSSERISHFNTTDVDTKSDSSLCELSSQLQQKARLSDETYNDAFPPLTTAVTSNKNAVEVVEKEKQSAASVSCKLTTKDPFLCKSAPKDLGDSSNSCCFFRNELNEGCNEGGFHSSETLSNDCDKKGMVSSNLALSSSTLPPNPVLRGIPIWSNKVKSPLGRPPLNRSSGENNFSLSTNPNTPSNLLVVDEFCNLKQSSCTIVEGVMLSTSEDGLLWDVENQMRSSTNAINTNVWNSYGITMPSFVHTTGNELEKSHFDCGLILSSNDYGNKMTELNKQALLTSVLTKDKANKETQANIDKNEKIWKMSEEKTFRTEEESEQVFHWRQERGNESNSSSDIWNRPNTSNMVSPTSTEDNPLSYPFLPISSKTGGSNNTNDFSATESDDKEGEVQSGNKLTLSLVESFLDSCNSPSPPLEDKCRQLKMGLESEQDEECSKSASLLIKDDRGNEVVKVEDTTKENNSADSVIGIYNQASCGSNCCLKRLTETSSWNCQHGYGGFGFVCATTSADVSADISKEKMCDLQYKNKKDLDDNEEYFSANYLQSFASEIAQSLCSLKENDFYSNQCGKVSCHLYDSSPPNNLWNFAMPFEKEQVVAQSFANFSTTLSIGKEIDAVPQFRDAEIQTDLISPRSLWNSGAPFDVAKKKEDEEHSVSPSSVRSSNRPSPSPVGSLKHATRSCSKDSINVCSKTEKLEDKSIDENVLEHESILRLSQTPEKGFDETVLNEAAQSNCDWYASMSSNRDALRLENSLEDKSFVYQNKEINHNNMVAKAEITINGNVAIDPSSSLLGLAHKSSSAFTSTCASYYEKELDKPKRSNPNSLREKVSTETETSEVVPHGKKEELVQCQVDGDHSLVKYETCNSSSISNVAVASMNDMEATMQNENKSASSSCIDTATTTSSKEEGEFASENFGGEFSDDDSTEAANYVAAQSENVLPISPKTHFRPISLNSEQSEEDLDLEEDCSVMISHDVSNSCLQYQYFPTNGDDEIQHKSLFGGHHLKLGNRYNVDAAISIGVAIDQKRYQDEFDFIDDVSFQSALALQCEVEQQVGPKLVSRFFSSWCPEATAVAKTHSFVTTASFNDSPHKLLFSETPSSPDLFNENAESSQLTNKESVNTNRISDFPSNKGEVPYGTMWSYDVNKPPVLSAEDDSFMMSFNHRRPFSCEFSGENSYQNDEIVDKETEDERGIQTANLFMASGEQFCPTEDVVKDKDINNSLLVPPPINQSSEWSVGATVTDNVVDGAFSKNESIVNTLNRSNNFHCEYSNNYPISTPHVREYGEENEEEIVDPLENCLLNKWDLHLACFSNIELNNLSLTSDGIIRPSESNDTKKEAFVNHENIFEGEEKTFATNQSNGEGENLFKFNENNYSFYFAHLANDLDDISLSSSTSCLHVFNNNYDNSRDEEETASTAFEVEDQSSQKPSQMEMFYSTYTPFELGQNNSNTHYSRAMGESPYDANYGGDSVEELEFIFDHEMHQLNMPTLGNGGGVDVVGNGGGAATYTTEYPVGFLPMERLCDVDCNCVANLPDHLGIDPLCKLHGAGAAIYITTTTTAPNSQQYSHSMPDHLAPHGFFGGRRDASGAVSEDKESDVGGGATVDATGAKGKNRRNRGSRTNKRSNSSECNANSIFPMDQSIVSHRQRKRRKSVKESGSGVGVKFNDKPCSYFLEGQCHRLDCKFSHDLASIPCRFFAEGNCFKSIFCPFSHCKNITPIITSSFDSPTTVAIADEKKDLLLSEDNKTEQSLKSNLSLNNINRKTSSPECSATKHDNQNNDSGDILSLDAIGWELGAIGGGALGAGVVSSSDMDGDIGIITAARIGSKKKERTRCRARRGRKKSSRECSSNSLAKPLISGLPMNSNSQGSDDGGGSGLMGIISGINNKDKNEKKIDNLSNTNISNNNFESRGDYQFKTCANRRRSHGVENKDEEKLEGKDFNKFSSLLSIVSDSNNTSRSTSIHTQASDANTHTASSELDFESSNFGRDTSNERDCKRVAYGKIGNAATTANENIGNTTQCKLRVQNLNTINISFKDYKTSKGGLMSSSASNTIEKNNLSPTTVAATGGLDEVTQKIGGRTSKPRKRLSKSSKKKTHQDVLLNLNNSTEFPILSTTKAMAVTVSDHPTRRAVATTTTNSECSNTNEQMGNNKFLASSSPTPASQFYCYQSNIETVLPPVAAITVPPAY